MLLLLDRLVILPVDLCEHLSYPGVESGNQEVKETATMKKSP